MRWRQDIAARIPPARLAWLAAILRERFSDEIILSTSGSYYRLAFAGSSDVVLLRCTSDLPNGVSDVPCGSWDPATEGWSSPLGKPLPTPGQDLVAGPLIECHDGEWRVNYDILGFMYWMLSRAEEVDREDLDMHGRFPAIASHAHRHGYLERPVVDEWLWVLRQVIQRRWPSAVLRVESPTIRATHDVDSPSRYGFASIGQLARAMAGDVVKRRSVGAAIRAPFHWINCRDNISPNDPSNTFAWLMDQSERIGIKSAFYFICGRTDQARDAQYDPEHPAIRSLMRTIHERGHEIGLHPSYNTFMKPDAIAAEADRLRKVCWEEGIDQGDWGGRMHFLRWRVGRTLRGWEKAQMAYDSTLGYADLPGFRCGTCHEYQGFDPIAQEPSRVRIRPLIAMECTIIAPRYMGLGVGDKALEKFRELRAACEAVHGSFTLLWHNSEVESHARRALYRAVLN